MSKLRELLDSEQWQHAMEHLNGLSDSAAAQEILYKDNSFRTNFILAIEWGMPAELIQRMVEICRLNENHHRKIAVCPGPNSWLPEHYGK
jgi:hypothetical protein